MKVHVLGCGDAFGSGGRNQTSYLIESSDRVFLLDCGPTTLLSMKRAGFDPRRLDAVILSHLHGDHCGGIPFLFIEYLYQSPRAEPLTLAGPPGTETKVRQLFQLMYGGGSGAKDIPPTRFQVLHPDRPDSVAGVQVFPFRVPHQIDEISLGLKVGYEGKQVLFSGDSAWSDIFIEQARGTDLFLCECSFYEQGSGNHVSFAALRPKLPSLQCKRLVLVHLGDEMLARGSDLGVTLAEDGMVIEL
jgi:ribonuclease BN (tRNA processing enzyme)